MRSVLWFGAGEPVRDSCFSHCAVACALAVIDAPAQQYLTTLQTFNGANGSGVSSPLIQGTNGNLYGTSYTEGSPCNGGPGGPGCGTVFQVTPSNVMTTLYVFCSLPNCADGQNPSGAIVQGADGNIYGTTFLGGANNSGTVFQLTPEGVLTTLYSFSGDYRADYGGPGGLLLGSDGNFYGTTNYITGGPYGTIFQITPSGTFTTLWNFYGDSSVGGPIGTLAQDSSGNFWGATTSPGCGAVFEFTGGSASVAFSFDSSYNISGCVPASVTVGADGNIYGTTKYGGQSGSPGGPCSQDFLRTTRARRLPASTSLPRGLLR